MKTGWNMVGIWFGALMVLIVLAGAFAFAFTDFMDDRLYGNKRILFVVMLSSYAVYRGFRLRSAIRNSDR